MYSGKPGATGNHVTGSDYGQVCQGMSSMPAKKRLAVEYREMAPRHSDSTCVAASRLFQDPPSIGHGFRDNGRQGDDVRIYCNPHDNGRPGSEAGWPRAGHLPPRCHNSPQAECADGWKDDLLANKQKVLGLIADVLASGATNEEKERKLSDIIDDLETVRRRLAQQTAAQLKVLSLLSSSSSSSSSKILCISICMSFLHDKSKNVSQPIGFDRLVTAAYMSIPPTVVDAKALHRFVTFAVFLPDFLAHAKSREYSRFP